MRKLWLLLAVGGLGVVGCQEKPASPKAEAVSPDVQIVTETIEAGGITVNNEYTVPVSPADIKASPNDVLYDASGEPYRIVKKLGLHDEQ